MASANPWADSRVASTTNTTEADPLASLTPADSKAHIVFVPGAWHTLFHTQPLVTTLSASGYQITPHQLASVGLKTPRPTFADEVTGIRSAVTDILNTGCDAILVLHSYAGIAGSEAINQLIDLGCLSESSQPSNTHHGRLRRIVYISAHMFPANFVIDVKRFVGDSDPMFSINESTGTTHFADPYHGFFNDMTRDDAQPFVDHIGQMYYLGAEPVITSDKYRSAPVIYVQCEQDNAFPLERQEGVSAGMPTIRLKTGHDPFISQSKIIAEILAKVASSQ